MRHLTIKGGMIGSVDYALLAVIIAARRVFSWLDVIVVQDKLFLDGVLVNGRDLIRRN